MNKQVRAAVFARADGHCECGCGRWLGDSGQLDHFFGRAKAEETVENCWALTAECHDRKTRNSPSAETWLLRFIGNAELLKDRVDTVSSFAHEDKIEELNRWWAAIERAEAKLEALKAKGRAM